MTVFSATFDAVSVSAAQDLFEIVAPTNSRVRLLEIDIGQYSPLDVGDTEEEIVGLLIMRGHTTTGSGGSAVSANNVNPYGRADGATIAANNTTVATSGTIETLWATQWHVQAGFIWRPLEVGGINPHRRFILIKPDQRLVIRITAPADELTTVNGSILFEEIGKAPID